MFSNSNIYISINITTLATIHLSSRTQSSSLLYLDLQFRKQYRKYGEFGLGYEMLLDATELVGSLEK